MMKARAEAFVVADDVADFNVVGAADPTSQLDCGGELPAVAHDLGVGYTHVLHPDRTVVQTNCVAAHVTQWHELVDRAVGVNDEVRAGPGQLAKLHIWLVRREGVVGGCVVGGLSPVFNQNARCEQVGVLAVMADCVGSHLPLADWPKRNPTVDDPRLRHGSGVNWQG